MSRAVGILGGGRWGRTLAWRIAHAGFDAKLWTRNPERVGTAMDVDRADDESDVEHIHITDDLSEALKPSLVLVAVPPGAVRSLVRDAADLFRPEHAVVHVVKGLEAGGATVSQIVEQETVVIRTGALAGPWVAEELRHGDDTAAVIGSRFQAVVDEVTDVLATPQVRVYGTLDLVGVEVGGAMRTPIAIASGICQAAGLGRSLHAVLLTRGIAEAARLSEALGGERVTLSGLSGIGDWMLTTSDADDELVRVGRRLAAGKPADHAEGEARVRTLVALARERSVDLPITEAIGEILDGTPPTEALAALMSREQRPEAT